MPLSNLKLIFAFLSQDYRSITTATLKKKFFVDVAGCLFLVVDTDTSIIVVTKSVTTAIRK